MANSNVRVNIPRNPEELLSLAEKIYAKHQADGAASPLNTLEDDNWTDNGPKVAQAKTLQDQIKQLEKDIEKMYEQRDALMKGIGAAVKATRTALQGRYSKSPKKLGDYGFEVDYSPRAKKTAKA